MEPRLPLQLANAFQRTFEDGTNSSWVIRENQTDTVMFDFQIGKIPDDVMFRFLDFMRQAELEAFNIGINYQKEVNRKQENSLPAALEQIATLNQRIDYLQQELQRTQELL